MKKIIYTFFAMLPLALGANAQAIEVYNGSILMKTFVNDESNKYKVIATQDVQPIKVTQIEISGGTVYVGSNTVFTTTVTPEIAYNRGVTWTSSNPSVATVDINTGEVKGISAGEATITATANDGSNVSGTCNVTVSSRPNLLSGEFSVAANKKVYFTKGAIYSDGTGFHFEENQIDFNVTGKSSHNNYLSSSEVTNFTESSGGQTVDGTDNLYLLSKDEWNYILVHSPKSNGVLVDDKTCLVIAPDNFSGTLKSSYTLDEVYNLGLVCLPEAGCSGGVHVGFGALYFTSTSGYSLHFNHHPSKLKVEASNLSQLARLVRTVQTN